MTRGMFGCAAAALVCVVSLTCETTDAADPGFYVAAAGGRSEQRLDRRAGVGPTPVLVLPPPLTGVAFPRLPPGSLPPAFGVVTTAAQPASLSADEADIGWNVALGYRVNKYLAAELSYMDSGKASLVERYRFMAVSLPMPDIIRSYSVNTDGPAVSLFGSLPLGAQWEVFIRGGVLFASQEVEARVFSDGGTAGGSRIERDFSDEVVNLGAGVQWSFLPRWTARLEYQRTGDLQANEIMGASRLDQASISVLFGL